MQEINNEKENKSNSNSLEIQIQSDSKDFAPIFKSKLKIRILMTLLIYPELTLTQISEMMGKVKSTISKHMEELLQLGLVKRRERQYRSDKKQHIYSKIKKFGFRGLGYKDLKGKPSEEIHSALNEEYIINKRLFSYILEVNTQVLDYIKEFYEIKPQDITDEFMEDIYRYDTCVPGFRFMTKEEYTQYRDEFEKFNENFINKMEKRREKETENKSKEYLVIQEFVPIKQVMEHFLEKKKHLRNKKHE